MSWSIVPRAFLKRGLQEALSYRAAFGLQLVVMAFSLSSFFFLARFINTSRSPYLADYGGDYLGFGLVGMILLQLQYTAVSAYPKSIREAQMAGTLEAMLATPTPGWVVLLCAPLYQFISAFLWAVLYLLVGGLLFGMRFSSANGLSLALALPLCLVAFASLGFFASALTMLLRRSDPITVSLGSLSALLGGVFYPTAVLPGWLRLLGQALPITHALEIIRRATFTGASLQELRSSLLGLALFCATSAPLGLLAFGWTLKRARQDGSLNHF
jgi:ABC-2 type transport system permease protein